MNVAVVNLRMSQLQILDATGAQVITELVHGLKRRGITVLIKGIRPRTCTWPPGSVSIHHCDTSTTSLKRSKPPLSMREAIFTGLNTD